MLASFINYSKLILQKIKNVSDPLYSRNFSSFMNNPIVILNCILHDNRKLRHLPQILVISLCFSGYAFTITFLHSSPFLSYLFFSLFCFAIYFLFFLNKQSYLYVSLCLRDVRKTCQHLSIHTRHLYV